MSTATASPSDIHWGIPFSEIGYVRTEAALGGGMTARGSGVRYTEHAGWITPFTVGVPIALVQVFTLQTDEVIGVETERVGADTLTTETRCEGSGSNQRCADYSVRTSSRLEVRVKTRPLPPEVVAENMRRQERLLRAATVRPMQFALEYYPERDDDSLRGVDVTWYPLTLPLTFLARFDAGYNYTRLAADVMMSGTMTTVRHRAHAIPLRFTLKPVLWAYASAEIGLNLLGFADEKANESHSSTARFELTAKPPPSVPILHRLYLRGALERRLVDGGGPWTNQFEVGLSF